MSAESKSMTRAFPTDQARGGSSLTANTSGKRLRDEDEVMKAKLADQSFDISEFYVDILKDVSSDSMLPSEKYQDPLLPRQTAASSFLPKGVTADMERKWIERIENFRNAGI